MRKYNGNVKNDIDVANSLGTMLIDTLNPMLKSGCKVVHTEILKESIAKMLDVYSGIDAVLLSKSDMSGVALRIQKHSNKNHKTFTIRYSRSTGVETEYSKRKRQIYNGYPSFYPHYTCQVYYDDENKLLGGAFCKTKDLFDVAIKNEPLTRYGDVYIQVNTKDNNEFVVVPFSKIKRIVLIEPKDEPVKPSQIQQ